MYDSSPDMIIRTSILFKFGKTHVSLDLEKNTLGVFFFFFSSCTKYKFFFYSHLVLFE